MLLIVDGPHVRFCRGRPMTCPASKRTFDQLGAAPWAARVRAARVPEENVNRIFTPPA
jgi:hypothetical protein